MDWWRKRSRSRRLTSAEASVSVRRNLQVAILDRIAGAGVLLQIAFFQIEQANRLSLRHQRTQR